MPYLHTNINMYFLMLNTSVNILSTKFKCDSELATNVVILHDKRRNCAE